MIIPNFAGIFFTGFGISRKPKRDGIDAMHRMYGNPIDVDKVWADRNFEDLMVEAVSPPCDLISRTYHAGW